MRPVDRALRRLSSRRAAEAPPLAMPDGAVLLFDAAAGVTKTGTPPFETGSEHAVTAWQNGGVGIAAATDPGASFRPVWSPGVALGAWAGIPYVRFSGAQVLLMPGGFWGDGVAKGNRDWTMVGVLEQTGSGTRRIVQSQVTLPTLFGFNSTRFSAYDASSSTYRSIEPATPTVPRTACMSARMTATETRGWLGRIEGGSSPTSGGQSGVSGVQSTLAASSATGAAGLVGKIYLLSVYDRALSDADIQAAWDYLESRFPAAF